jgi:hypothetical protein
VLRPRLKSVRLSEVERALLHFHRQDDIDGAEIPGRYLRYLRGADPRSLLPVLTHNAHDVVALGALLWRLCAHFDAVQQSDDPLDHLQYARIALRARDLARADEFARAAQRGGETQEIGHKAYLVSAAVARLRADWDAVLHALQQALELAGDRVSAAQTHLALSRLLERKFKDLPSAHRHARHTLLAEGPEAHGRRLGRLRRRLERSHDSC